MRPRSTLLIVFTLLASTFLSTSPAFAGDELNVTFDKVQGVATMDWSKFPTSLSPLSGQTGWRIGWKKNTESAFHTYDISNISTTKEYHCMSYTSQEETYEVARLKVVGGGTTVGAFSSNTWTYSGAIAQAGVSCLNYTEPTGKPVTVTFSNNTGSGTMASQVINGPTSFTLTANTFTKSNATFAGWNTAANGSGTSYTDSQLVNIIPATPSAIALFAQWTYNITVSAGANGTITTGSSSGPSAASPTTVLSTASQTFYIQGNSGYHVASVTVDTVDQGALASYTFSSLTANHTISATFAINTYSINSSVNNSSGGSISPSGSTTVNQGANQTYSITTNAGYTLSSLTIDGSSATAASSYTFSGVTASHSIQANFTINSYQITVTSPTHGSLSPGTNTSVSYGGSRTFSTTADLGYHLTDIVVDGISQGNSSSSYTFSTVNQAHTIAASFAINTYSVDVTAGTHGSISPSSGTVNYGDSPVYTITADAGYSISDVVVDGVSQGALSSVTLSSVTAHHTISATFAINTFTMTVTQGAHGTISPGSSTENYGSSKTYTITPATGYSIASVTVDGVSRGAVSTYTISTIQASHTITASYSINSYQITVTAPTHGTLSPGSTSVTYGGSQIFSTTPDTGYHLADILVDGISQGNSSSSYTFSSVNQAHTIAATFEIDTFSVLITSGANGSISPTSQTVNYGTSPVYTITPATGYAISSLYVDGISQSIASTVTFASINADHSISATFAIRTFAMTVTQGAHGSITSATTGVANYNTSRTYTITPATGYSIASVTVDGSAVSPIPATYTFASIQAAHSITASFVINTYRITVSPTTHGTISPSTTDVTYGVNQTFTFTPDTGYEIASVSTTRLGPQDKISELQFSSVSQTDTITVTFSKINYTISIIPASNGTISAASTSVPYGDSDVITITPATGYQIDVVKIDGTSVGAVTTYTLRDVTAGHTVTALFKFVPVVRISSFTPLSFGSGDLVTIYTSSPEIVTAVKFNGVAAQSFSTVNGNIVAKAPTSTTNGKVTLSTLSLNPASTSAASFTFLTAVVTAKPICTATTATTTNNIQIAGCPAIKLPMPIISTFTPTSGTITAHTTITITGSNFSGITSVKINGKVATFTVVSGATITAQVPTGATSGKISVTNSAGTVNSNGTLTITA